MTLKEMLNDYDIKLITLKRLKDNLIDEKEINFKNVIHNYSEKLLSDILIEFCDNCSYVIKMLISVLNENYGFDIRDCCAENELVKAEALKDSERLELITSANIWNKYLKLAEDIKDNPHKFIKENRF